MGLFAENHFNSISFGFNKESITFYCQCDADLSLIQDLVSRLMPLLVLGIVPAILGILLNKNFIFQMSLIMIMSAGGDILSSIMMISKR